MTEFINKEWFGFPNAQTAIAAIVQMDQAHNLNAVLYDENGDYAGVRQAGQTWAINDRGFLPEITDEEDNVLYAASTDYIVQVRALSEQARVARDEAWETYGIPEPDHPSRGSL